MAASASIIQKLRNVTGAGIMECKRALDESDGDLDRAAQLIRERGLAKVEKRAGKETGAGLIHAYVHSGRIGVLVDLRAETDFVVRSEPFQKLSHDIAMHIAAAAPDTVDELLKQPYIKDESRPMGDIIKEVIGRVGENITVRAFSRLEL